MSTFLRRLAFAAIFASVCYGAIEYWYIKSAPERSHQRNREPIAQLEAAINGEVQRKPLARVIWETITQNEQLYAGEVIRTSPVAEARILFLESDTMIELEPDSLIVLEENESGISLDFLKGNVFVKSGGNSEGKEGTNLTLKTGDSQIDLRNADLSLSKTGKGDVDLQVFDGTANVKQGDKTLQVNKDRSGTLTEKGLSVDDTNLEVVSPLPGDPVYINTDKREQVAFQWKKLPAGYKVFLERGPRRSQLSRAKISAQGPEGQLLSHSKPGKLYWRLVAESDDPKKPDLRSKILSVRIVPVAPPVLLTPEDKAVVVIDNNNPVVDIKWVTRSKLESMVLEVARDKNLKNKIYEEPLDTKLSFSKIKLDQPGDYFWRITGYMNIKGKMRPIASEVKNFELQMGVELVPPVLKSPLHQQALSFEKTSDAGVFVSWETVPGIQQYRLLITRLDDRGPANERSEKVFDEKVTTTPYRVEGLAPGRYQWTVASLNVEGEASAPSEMREFLINKMPVIEWADGPEPGRHLYLTSKPSIEARWMEPTNKIVAYRIRFNRYGLTAETPWRTLKKRSLQTYVDEDGLYELEVEGLNTKGQVVARSARKQITVTEMPLLPAPEFVSELPERLKADRKGNLSVSWQPVEGSTKYIVQLKNKEGQVVTEQEANAESFRFSRLRPGTYQVSVKAVDQHKRPGVEGEQRPLEVPNNSDIQAPKIKRIKVQ